MKHTTSPVTIKPARAAGGFALVFVMLTVAFSAALAFAVVSAASVKASAFSNSISGEQAYRVAQAGVAYAMRQIQYPAGCGTSRSSPFSGTSVVSVAGGKATVTVTDLGSDKASIVSTATVGGVQRTSTVTVQANWTYAPVAAIQCGSGAVTLPALSTITGDLISGGSVKLSTGTSISGTIVSPSVINLLSGLTCASPDVTQTVTNSPCDYETYTYAGANYSAILVGPNLQNITLGPTAANPAGVFLCKSGNLAVKGNVVVNGTLVAKGLLTVSGTGNVITPKSGFPGLVAGDKLSLLLNGQLTVNGTAYIAKGILNALLTKLTVKGSLVIAAGGFLSLTGLTLNVMADLDNAVATGLDPNPTLPSSLTVLSWQ